MHALQTALSEYLHFCLFYGVPIILIFACFVYLLSRQRYRRIAHKIAQKDAILAQQNAEYSLQFKNQHKHKQNE